MKFVFVFFGLLYLGISGCKPDCNPEAGKDIMGIWYKKQIRFPDKLDLVNKESDKNAIYNTVDITKAKFSIVHFFNADCDECINALLTAQKFIQRHPVTCNLQYLFIACGPSNIYVREAVRKSNFSMPVYFEKIYYSFKKLNQFPLSDKAYDTMLINDKGELLLFGGVFSNAKAEELFLKITTCEKCNKNE